MLLSGLVIGAILFGVLWNQLKPEPGDLEEGEVFEVPLTRPVVAFLEWRPEIGTSQEVWLEPVLCETLVAALEAKGRARPVPCAETYRMRGDLDIGPQESWGPTRLTEAAGNLGAEVLLRGKYSLEGDGAEAQWRLSLSAVRIATGGISTLESATGEPSAIPALTAQLSGQLASTLGLESDSPSNEKAEETPSGGAHGFPTSEMGLRSYGIALGQMARGDFVGGREDFVAALAVDPDSPRLHAALASSLAARGFEAEALAAVDQGIDRAGGMTGPFFTGLQAMQYRLRGNFLTAAEGYRQLRRARPDDLEMGLLELRALATAGAIERAQKVLEEIRKLPGLASSDPRIDLMAAELAGTTGDFRKQLAAAQQAATAAELRQAKQWLTTAELSRAGALLRLRDVRGAQRAVDRAATLTSPDDSVGQARIENSRAVIASILGDFENAEASFLRSLELYRQQADLGAVAGAISNLSKFLAGAARGEEALSRLQEGKEIFRRLGSQAGLAKLLALEANIHRQVGNLAKAEAALRRALQEAPPGEESSQRAELLYQLGGLQASRETFAASQSSYEACLELVSGKGRSWPRLASRAHAGIAEVLLIGDDLVKAREHQERALALHREAGDDRGVAYRRLALASVTLEEGRLDEAITATQELVTTFEDMGQVEGLVGAHVLQARSYLEQRQLPQARQALKAAAALASPNSSVASQLSVSFLDARLALAENRSSQTVRRLEGLARSARATQQRGIELEVELALGLEELVAGRVEDGRERLETVVAGAERDGFLLIARKASFAL